MQKTRNSRVLGGDHGLVLACGTMLLMSLSACPIWANVKDDNRQRLIDALVSPEGGSLSVHSANAVSTRVPDKVAAEIVAMPGEDRILLYNNWIPLPSSDTDSSPDFQRIVTVLSSQEHALLAAVKEWSDSGRVIWDTVIVEIMQPRLDLIRLGDGADTSDVVIAAGSPSTTRIRHFALVEWSTSGCQLIGDFAGLEVDTFDIDNDGVAELKVRDIKNYNTKELVDLIYKRNRLSKRFEYLESRAVTEGQ